MWAQGLTIGILIAAGALTHARRQQALDEHGLRHIVRTPSSRTTTVLMICCRSLITRGEISSSKRARRTRVKNVLEDLKVVFGMSVHNAGAADPGKTSQTTIERCSSEQFIAVWIWRGRELCTSKIPVLHFLQLAIGWRHLSDPQPAETNCMETRKHLSRQSHEGCLRGRAPHLLDTQRGAPRLRLAHLIR